MTTWEESPIVTFERNGQAITLGRSPDDYLLHLHGSLGLGLPQVEMSKSPRLTRNGSIVNGIRFVDREIYLPIYVERDSVAELNQWRRDLTRLLTPVPGNYEASLVNITIEDPTTETTRMIRGVMTDGLSGDFSDGYYGTYQTFGLTFECDDPDWLGPERTMELRVNPGSKPFLSDYEYSRKNLAHNPSMESLLGQLGGGLMAGSSNATVQVSTEWAGSGTSSLKIIPDGVNSASSALLMPYTSNLRGAEFAGKTITVGLDLRLASVQTGTISSLPRSIGIGYVNGAGSATTPEGHWSDPAPNTVGVHRIVKTLTIPADARGIYIFVRSGDNTTPVWVDNLTIEEGTTDGSYFDGYSEGAKWMGQANASASGLIVPGSGSPFFPVVLAGSSVQGEFEIDIAGDSPVWGTWEVVGPGEDLVISNGKEFIEISGQFTSTPVQIDTETGRITPDRWEDASLRTRLFPLQPGRQTITITMVNATLETVVRLTYQERFLEGY